jgi:hypothetical protein
MDEKKLELSLAEELIKYWDIDPTGTGFMITTDWQWPNRERIEIYVRSVGEREDLYLVTDGGELYNFLFSHGIDLSKDTRAMKVLDGVFDNYGVRFVDYQIAKGANDEDLHQVIRVVLEAIKDSSFILRHKLEQTGDLH